MVRNLVAALRRTDSRISSLSRAHRLNMALYAFALMGLGLIALEVRQTDVSPREVRSLPTPPTTATVGPVVAPGDRRPVDQGGPEASAAPEPLPTSPESGPGTDGAAPMSTSAGALGSSASPSAADGFPAPSPAQGGGPAPIGGPLQIAPDYGGGFPGGSAVSPAMSLIPGPPPLPALPSNADRSSAAPIAGTGAGPVSDLHLPAPAQPVTASPPPPRISGPASASRPR